jgi:hypothetical protein
MLRFLPIALCVLFLSSCAKESAVPAAGAAAATVVLRDGSTVQGKVLESSATEIKIATADLQTRIIPMSTVRRVDYGETASPVEPKSTADAKAVASKPAAGSQPPRAAVKAPEAERPREEHVHPPAAAVTTKTNTLATGTSIPVRVEETIDSGKAEEGQTFAADVTRDVKDADGDVVIPRGAHARIVILSASKGGKFRGKSDLVLDLVSVSIDGKQYQLSTSNWAQKGRDGVGINKRTGEFAGGGAAVGAIIGAIAGGGKGAAIGAGAGAGAGAAAQIITKGGAIKVPVETVLTFQLDKPLRVVASE